MSVAREIALGAGAAILFCGVIAAALTWSPETAMFPMVIGIAVLVTWMTMSGGAN